MQSSRNLKVESLKQKPLTHETRISHSSPVSPSSNNALKKSRLLKRKNHVTSNSSEEKINKMFMIGETVVFNESALIDPKNQRECFLMNSLYFNVIKTLTVNQQYCTVSLKRVRNNMLSEKEMLDHLLAIEGQSFKNISHSVQGLLSETEKLKNIIKNAQQEYGKENYQIKINYFNDKRQELFFKLLQRPQFAGKSFIGLLQKLGKDGLNLEKIVISDPMLKLTGYKSFDLISEYYTDKRLNYEFMTSYAYKTLLQESCKKTGEALQTQRLKYEEDGGFFKREFDEERPNMEQTIIKTEIQQKTRGQLGLGDKGVQVEVQFFKPFAEVSIFVFEPVCKLPDVLNPKDKQVLSREILLIKNLTISEKEQYSNGPKFQLSNSGPLNFQSKQIPKDDSGNEKTERQTDF